MMVMDKIQKQLSDQIQQLYNDCDPILNELEEFTQLAKKNRKKCYKTSWKVARKVIGELENICKKYESFLNESPDLKRSIGLLISVYDHYDGGRRTTQKPNARKEIAKDLILLYENLVIALDSYSQR